VEDEGCVAGECPFEAAKRMRTMGKDEYEAIVAAFIAKKGITRCPTACVSPTQGTVDNTDRAALEVYAGAYEWLRQQRIVARRRLFSGFSEAS
jgi:hypothetical protein